MSKHILKNLGDSEVEAIASRFRALGESSRLNIIRALHESEKTVTELVEQTGLNQPNVSRHLAVLVGAGLVGKRKEGLNVFYRIIDENLSEICLIVCKSALQKK